MKGLSISDRKILLSSPYVSKLTEKSISFSLKFRKLLIQKISSGMTRKDLFNSLLGVTCFDKKYVDSCLNRWRKQDKYKTLPESRGRKKDIYKMTIEELRAANALQKETIQELKKIHGLTDDETFGF